ncbi:Autolytic lysozyme [compost metagenome]
MIKKAQKGIVSLLLLFTFIGVGFVVIPTKEVSAHTINTALIIFRPDNPNRLLYYNSYFVNNYNLDVSTLQRDLRAMGYSVGVDGYFGQQTKNAVIAFQRQHGLAADGIVGPATWASIVRHFEW